MAFLFAGNRRQKQPIEIAKSLKELLQRLWEPVVSPKVEEEVAKYMASMKLIVQGTPEVDCSPEQVHQLVSCIIQEDILYELARSIRLLPFEARKDAQVIFSHILRFRPANAKSDDPSAISYLVLQRPEIIVELCRGYDYPEIAMACGTILRQALQHEPIAALILYDESKSGERAVDLNEVDVGKKRSGEGLFWNFFRWIDKSSFEVSVDAFTTFRDILTKHKQMVCQYLCANFDLFFSMYNAILLKSESYVTKRQSIKLLGEILLDRANYPVMIRYVDSYDNLVLHIELMEDGRKMIQYEAFHVFKVFVAKPDWSEGVHKHLFRNKKKFVRVLSRFLEDRTEDDQFLDEKNWLIMRIQDAKPWEPPKNHAKEKTVKTNESVLSPSLGA